MLKKSKVAAVFAAIALAVSSAPASNAATDKQLEIFTWWASGGEAAGLAGMTTEFERLNPNTPFINASVAGAAGVNAKGVLVSRMQAGNPPDTFQAHAGEELSSYVKAGQIEDLLIPLQVKKVGTRFSLRISLRPLQQMERSTLFL
jgi:glucose/mannose transport system substrate-binding protein